MELDDAFGYLLGRWQVRRLVRDGRAGTTFSFSGEARVSPLKPREGARTARYEEQGELAGPAGSGPASRRLTIEELADGRLRLFLADGSFFVDLDLRAGSSSAVHPCGDDCYEIETRPLGPERFEERWRVSGPEKSYEALTSYERLGPSS